MSANVQSIHSNTAENEDIDVRDEHQQLLDAEHACLNALEKCSNANASLVRFMNKMSISVTQVGIRKALEEAQTTLNHAFDLSQAISRTHRTTQKIVDGRSDTIIMTGGIGKDEKGMEYYDAI